MSQLPWYFVLPLEFFNQLKESIEITSMLENPDNNTTECYINCFSLVQCCWDIVLKLKNTLSTLLQEIYEFVELICVEGISSPAWLGIFTAILFDSTNIPVDLSYIISSNLISELLESDVSNFELNTPRFGEDLQVSKAQKFSSIVLRSANSPLINCLVARLKDLKTDHNDLHNKCNIYLLFLSKPLSF
jgi:hypothetical protein